MTVLEPVIGYLATCGKKRVALKDVVAGAERPRRAVREVMCRLEADGYLLKVKEKIIPHNPKKGGPDKVDPTWKIVGDLRKRPKRKHRKGNTQRDKLWKLIRAKRYFTRDDLALTSGCHPSTVRTYLCLLERDGHIRRTGKDGMKITYMVITQSVKRPMITGQYRGKPNG